MSGFEENPFGEPTVNDPFSDPSVRRTPAAAVPQSGIEDYNPFADPPVHGNAQGTNSQQVRGASNPPMYGGFGATQQPATLQPTVQEPPPLYTRNPQQTVPPKLSPTLQQQPTSQPQTGADWRARREEEIRNSNYYPGRNNWPPLPEQCCFQPCFYQDIDVEIDTEFQNIVRQLYYLWLFHFSVLCLNLVGQLANMLITADIQSLLMAIVWIFILAPFSFVCWFRPSYKAFKTDSSINFMVFFFMFTFQLVITSFQALGWSGPGICGLFYIVPAFKASRFLGVMMIPITAGFFVSAFGMFLMLTKVHRIYRSSSASVAKAQQEFTTNFMQNEHVRSAASEVATNAIRTQVSNATQPRF